MLSERIVVIDDDRRVIESLELALTEYELTCFRDGESALDYLSKPNLVSVILLDVKMPGQNGLAVLEAIRKTNKDVSIIMITGYGTKDVVLQALRQRADAFIEKPFDPMELKQTIKGLLKEKNEGEAQPLNNMDRIDRIKRFIKKNFKEANLHLISDEMYLSPKYISRMFKSENDLSFRDFKIQVKMDRAKELLSHSHMNVNQIALELGYQNPESFMRVFKRIHQITPSQYRKQCTQFSCVH